MRVRLIVAVLSEQNICHLKNRMVKMPLQNPLPTTGNCQRSDRALPGNFQNGVASKADRHPIAANVCAVSSQCRLRLQDDHLSTSGRKLSDSRKSNKLLVTIIESNSMAPHAALHPKPDQVHSFKESLRGAAVFHVHPINHVWQFAMRGASSLQRSRCRGITATATNRWRATRSRLHS